MKCLLRVTALLALGAPLLLCAPSAEAVVTHYSGAHCETQYVTFDQGFNYDAAGYDNGSVIPIGTHNVRVVCPLQAHDAYTNIERATALVDDQEYTSIPISCTLRVSHGSGTQIDEDSAISMGGTTIAVATLSFGSLLPGDHYFMSCDMPAHIGGNASRIVGFSVEEER